MEDLISQGGALFPEFFPESKGNRSEKRMVHRSKYKNFPAGRNRE
jgi:hypothetical protein